VFAPHLNEFSIADLAQIIIMIGSSILSDILPAVVSESCENLGVDGKIDFLI